MKKAIHYLANKHQRAVWLRAFRLWQRRPHQVAPLSEVVHNCTTCGTEYQGNYCPRCGQSASVGRFSFKKAFLLFLDVWGVGNRGMFRSIRDLILRPGYMIRDYLNGMQSAYFPPFKMFFLLTALSLVVEHGIDLGIGGNGNSTNDSQTELTFDEEEVKADTDVSEIKKQRFVNAIKTFISGMDGLSKKNPAIFSLLSLMLFSLPLYMFFRRSPAIPDLRYSEFFVALVYTSNMFSIYSILGDLLHFGILKTVALLMIFVLLKQFSGFSKKRVFVSLLLTMLISFVGLITIIFAGVYIIYAFS